MSMRRGFALVILSGVALAGSLASADDDGDDARVLRARLAGFDETPAVSSTGKGQFRARISRDEDTVEFELSYEGLEGAVAVAHIHVGQRHTAGGVAVFLCGGGGRPACPPSPGRVRGTFGAADVIGPTGQGVAPMELDEVVRAMRAQAAYVNVHTDKHPPGEIRGQIRGDD